VQTLPDTSGHRIERIRKPPVGSSSLPVGLAKASAAEPPREPALSPMPERLDRPLERAKIAVNDLSDRRHLDTEVFMRE
jgi:hypothetical protein